MTMTRHRCRRASGRSWSFGRACRSASSPLCMPAWIHRWSSASASTVSSFVTDAWGEHHRPARALRAPAVPGLRVQVHWSISGAARSLVEAGPVRAVLGIDHVSTGTVAPRCSRRSRAVPVLGLVEVEAVLSVVPVQSEGDTEAGEFRLVAQPSQSAWVASWALCAHGCRVWVKVSTFVDAQAGHPGVPAKTYRSAWLSRSHTSVRTFAVHSAGSSGGSSPATASMSAWTSSKPGKETVSKTTASRLGETPRNQP